jgi:hypothetical protein
VRFEIARERQDAPVRVLPLLTVPTIAELQGRNGIGKSLSVKLLELLTGHQPWLGEDEAWRTLRDHLGPTSVTASGLAGGQNIEWDLVPQAWPKAPPPDVGELCVPAESGTGLEIRIDGAAASLSDVRALVRVHRLVGDETLEDSVDSRISHMASRARRESAAIGDASERVRVVIAEAMGALEPLSGRVVRRLSDRVSELETKRKELLERHHKEEQRVGRLLGLEQRSRALARLEELEASGTAGELGTKLQAIDDELKNLRQERDRRFEAAVADVQLRQQIQDARAEVERVEGLLERAVEDARERASEAGLERPDADLDAETVAAAHDAVVEEIRQLRETQASQDVVPLVRQAATSVKRTLNRVDPSSVLEHPIAVLHERDVTGRQLVEGLDAELKKLDGAARDPSGPQLDTQIAATSARLDAIVELQRALARQRRHTTALHNRRAELLTLTEQASGDATATYVELEQRIGQLEDERRELQGHRFRHSILLEELGPGEDLPRARERLTRDLRAAGVVVDDDLVETRTSIEASLRETDYQLRQTQVSADEALRELASAQERAALGAEALKHTALIRALQAQGMSLEMGGDTEALAEQLLRACERVASSLNRLTAAGDAAVGAFQHLDDDGGDIDRSRIAHVRAVAEQHIVEALNQHVLQNELFDKGVVEGYDHIRKVVAFRPAGSASAVTRSLSAFSSGERVFAYTQMRLRAIPETEPPCENRIVVLDEFGAFLESRRVRALERLVEEELLGHGIDRVLFILPLVTRTPVNEHGYALLDRTAA